MIIGPNPSIVMLGGVVTFITSVIGCIEFVHIPKTGGTTIEATGCSAGIPWGACHFPSKSHCTSCVSDLADCDKGQLWHVPPSQHSRECGIHSYKRCKTFTVVRDPVERAISFFGCKWWGPTVKKNMDAWILKTYRSWIPQYLYLPVDHVLRYDSLAEDFTTLMQSYNLSLRISKRLNPSSNSNKKLRLHTVCTVARFFHMDYKVFNFTWPTVCLPIL